LVESDVEGARDGVFAAVVVAGEEDGESLLVARWVGFAEDADDFGVGEPFGDVTTGAEAAAEFWEECISGKSSEAGSGKVKDSPVPEMSRVRTSFATSSLGLYSSVSGR